MHDTEPLTIVVAVGAVGALNKLAVSFGSKALKQKTIVKCSHTALTSSPRCSLDASGFLRKAKPLYTNLFATIDFNLWKQPSWKQTAAATGATLLKNGGRELRSEIYVN